MYLANVDLPGKERYYSFNYKNSIHFIFINTEENYEWNSFNITSAQLSWLIKDLETTSIDFIVMVFHRPVYSIKDLQCKVGSQRVRKVLEPFFGSMGLI